MIAIGGALARRPGVGGHAWVFLNYLLGFRRLGHDVVFVDRLEPADCTDARGHPVAPEHSIQVAALADLMARFGLARCWSLLVGEQSIGLDRATMLDRVRSSELVVNVMGYVDDEEILGVARRTLFLDIDPGFGQMWSELGWHHMFSGHDRYATIGENVGTAECVVPTLGIDWITTKQPIVLDRWPVADGPGRGITSIGAWRGPFDAIDFGGIRYGLRAHAVRVLMDLPGRIRSTIELALDIDPSDHADISELTAHGWNLVDPHTVAADPDAYRSFVQHSSAELMVAKEMYTRARTGWFSDRSIAYLASGRPVVASDTGLGDHLPSGEGLLLFDDADGAAAALDDVISHPDRHRTAARSIAIEMFDSDLVLGRLLDECAR